MKRLRRLQKVVDSYLSRTSLKKQHKDRREHVYLLGNP
jgi:hypothetical protein